jgi:CRP-like cAMP-binding protein
LVIDLTLAQYLPAFRRQMDKWVILNDEEWSIFSSYLKLRVLRKKEHFTRSGEVCKKLGFILSGSLRLYHVKDGAEITGYFSLNNEFISSYKSFLKQEPGIPYIQALEDVVLITIDHSALLQLWDHPVSGHKMERIGRLIAEELVFCYEDRLEAFATPTPEERYASVLNNNPRILKHLPQHYLANYLGITPTSLSVFGSAFLSLSTNGIFLSYVSDFRGSPCIALTFIKIEYYAKSHRKYGITCRYKTSKNCS